MTKVNLKNILTAVRDIINRSSETAIRKAQSAEKQAGAAQATAKKAKTTADNAQATANDAKIAAENAIGADVVKGNYKLRVGEGKNRGYGFAILLNDSVEMNYTDTGIYDEGTGSILDMSGNSIFRANKTSIKKTVIETASDGSSNENCIKLYSESGIYTSLSADGMLFSTANVLRFGYLGNLQILRYIETPEKEYDAATKGYVDGKISDTEIFLQSSTPGSTKKFKITVDDSGTISATEVV